jgi:hypothetical protein
MPIPTPSPRPRPPDPEPKPDPEPDPELEPEPDPEPEPEPPTPKPIPTPIPSPPPRLIPRSFLAKRLSPTGASDAATATKTTKAMDFVQTIVLYCLQHATATILRASNGDEMMQVFDRPHGNLYIDRDQCKIELAMWLVKDSQSGVVELCLRVCS